MATRTVKPANRRRIVSPWFKQKLLSRIALFGFIVVAVVCFSLGAVGVGLGVVIVVGVGALAFFRQRRRWRSPPPFFGPPS
jgi:hypothetical protein